jgi:iron complex outermembrane recepter protein
MRRLSSRHSLAIFFASQLSIAALAASLGPAFAQQTASPPAASIPVPPVTVEQPNLAKPPALAPAAAVRKPSVSAPTPQASSPPPAKPRKAVARVAPTLTPPAPAPIDAQPPTPAVNTASKATLGEPRSGSLGVPTTAEARRDATFAPGAVSVVPDTAYKNMTPAATIKDVLDYVPGVFVQPKWGDDSRLSIRGSGLSRNFHGRGVSLLMDGIIPISTADGNSDFPEIDPSAYRYVEVYKGTNALRFGANALGGAINFVTPTGYDSNLFGASVDFGSFGLRKATVTSGAVAGAADYFVSFAALEQDGFRDHSQGESQRLSMNVGYRITPDVETRFYLNANRIHQDIPGAVTKANALLNPSGAFTAPGTPVTFSGQGNDNVDRDYQRNLDTLRVANRTTVHMGGGTVIEVGGFYMDRHLDHPIFAVVDNQHNEYGGFGRLLNDQMIGGYRNRLTAGVALHQGDVRGKLFRNELGTKGALFSDAEQTSRNTTIYVENALFVLPQVALVAGTQFVSASRKLDDQFLANGDQSGEKEFSFWSPKAGVVWDVTPTAQVFANISRGGEAPTFSEITITGAATTSLKVQEATTFEIGTRGAADGLKWEIAAYRSNLENEFQCLSTGAAGTCTQTNIAQSIHQGVEIGASARLLSGVFARGSRPDELWLNSAYTFSDFRFDNDAAFGDNQLPGAPRHYVRSELLYKHPSGVYFGPNVEWVPEAFFVDSKNTVKTESYALLGAKIGFDDGGRWSAYLEGRNLTDEAYISSASIATSANAASVLFEPGNGRAVYGGAKFKW